MSRSYMINSEKYKMRCQWAEKQVQNKDQNDFKRDFNQTFSTKIIANIIFFLFTVWLSFDAF